MAHLRNIRLSDDVRGLVENGIGSNRVEPTEYQRIIVVGSHAFNPCLFVAVSLAVLRNEGDRPLESNIRPP